MQTHTAIIIGAAIALYGCHAQPYRDQAQRAAYVKTTPCPATGSISGPCPGYQVDHVIALCRGGADQPSNMQWLSIEAHKEKTKDDIAACRKH